MVEENKIIKVIGKLSRGMQNFLNGYGFRYFEHLDEDKYDEYYFLPYVFKKSDLGEDAYEIIKLNEGIPQEIKKYLKELIG